MTWDHGGVEVEICALLAGQRVSLVVEGRGARRPVWGHSNVPLTLMPKRS